MSGRAIAALGLIAALAACGSEPGEAGPPDIAWGERECDRCRMILSEPRYAAAVRDAAGAVAVFDDVGCLAAWVRDGGEPARVWVHDEATGEWIDGREAVYARRPGLVTPMGSGLIALRNTREAPDGATLTYEDLIEETDHE